MENYKQQMTRNYNRKPLPRLKIASHYYPDHCIEQFKENIFKKNHKIHFAIHQSSLMLQNIGENPALCSIH